MNFVDIYISVSEAVDASLKKCFFFGTDGEFGGLCIRSFRSSIHGKMLPNPSMRREAAGFGGGFVINSVVDNYSPFCLLIKC